MNRGKFIVIEGIDGAGKSTIVTRLVEELPPSNCLTTREPGGTGAAEEIRRVLIAKRPDPLDVPTQLFLCGAFRRDHVVKVLKPALATGKHIICERFASSTYAYQVIASGGEKYKDFFLRIDPIHRDDLEPDLTVLLDVDPTIGIARKRGSLRELDVFEVKELSFHEAVRRGMKEYLADRPHVVVDASQPPDAVYTEVKRILVEEGILKA